MKTDNFKALLAGYVPLALLQAGLVIVAVAYFSRVLNPAEYGRYIMVMVAIQLVQAGAYFWLHSSFARFYSIARERARLAQHLSTGYVSFGVLAACSALCAAAIMAFAPASWAPYRELVLAGLAALSARSLLMLALESHRAAGSVARYSLLEGAQQALGLAFGVALIVVRGPAATAPVWGLALANLLCALIDAPYTIRMAGRFSFSREQLRAMAAYGFPLTLSYFLGVVIASSDRFFIAWLMNDSAVGIYSASYSLADRPLGMLSAWIGAAAAPMAFTAMERDGANGARRVMQKTANIFILLCLPAAAGLALVARPLSSVLVDRNFVQAR